MVAAVEGRRHAPWMPPALFHLICLRIIHGGLRVVRLIEALQAGTLRTRRSPAPGLTRRRAEVSAEPAVVLPRDFNWLARFVPGSLLPSGALRNLLEDPEMLGLLAASPRLVRTMRPLCRMIGVEMPKLPEPPVSVGPTAAPESAAGDGGSRPSSPDEMPEDEPCIGCGGETVDFQTFGLRTT
jgi:hypothetical protein